MVNPYQAIRTGLSRMLGSSVNAAGVRDLYTQFGYPQRILAVDYMELYLRNGIASRVVRAFPSSTWGEQPVIRDEAGDSDEEGSKSYSPFVDAVNTFFKKFRVMQYMERADRLSSIGQFGVLYMGFADGLMPSQPLNEGRNELLYLAAYGEPNLKIASWQTDIVNPRFGLPTLYTCMTGSFQERMSVRRSFATHWSRVLHVAEMLDQDEVYSTPTLMPVYNWLKDLEKVIGSSSESFWLNARGGLVLSADKEARIDAGALADMKEQLSDYQQQITRSLALQGTTAQLLQATVANPAFNVEKLMDLIAGAKGIPKRILMGSERSDLSSTQDEQNYSSKVGERRVNFASPSMLIPFVDMMIQTGNLPPPQGEWWIEWPDTNALGPAAQAAIAVQRSTALANYANSVGAEYVVPVQEFRVEFLGMSSEPDASLMDATEEPLDENDLNVQAGMAGKAQTGPDGLPLTNDAPAQDQALNGAQIAAIAAIVQGVVDKTMPPETAVRLILVSFPSLDESTAQEMIQPAIDFEAPVEPPKVVTVGPDGRPVVPAPGEPAQDQSVASPEPKKVPAATVANLVRRARQRAAYGLRANAAPRTLYVRRDVINAEAIRSWYRDQGVETMMPASEMHVTIMHSKSAVDWTKMPSDWSQNSDGTFKIAPGGMRMTDMFGPDRDVLVLCFASSDLSWRWGALREAGCSWSWGSDYTPHVTITTQPLPPEFAKNVQPYQGAIELGPEIWSEVTANWSDGVVENMRRLQP